MLVLKTFTVSAFRQRDLPITEDVREEEELRLPSRDPEILCEFPGELRRFEIPTD